MYQSYETIFGWMSYIHTYIRNVQKTIETILTYSWS
jgi:hypothetical protein